MQGRSTTVLLLGLTALLTLAFAAGLGYDIGVARSGDRVAVAATPAAQPTPPAGQETGPPVPGGTATPVPAPSATLGAAGVAVPRASAAARPRTGGSGGAAPPGSPVVIGAVISQSGAVDLTDMDHGLQAWVQTVNAQGGVDGHPVVLDVKDDQGNPAVGRSAFEQIVQEDHAVAVVSECAPLTDPDIVDEINQAGVPVIGDCVTTPAAQSSPDLWSVTVDSAGWQAIAARYIVKHQDQLRMHRPYVLCVNQPSVTLFCDGFSHADADAGGTSCSRGSCGGGYDTEQLLTTRAQYEVTALQIKASGADSIVSFLDPTNQLAFLQALEDQGMSPQTFPQYAPLGMDLNVLRTTGDFALGIYQATASVDFWDDTANPAVARMHDAFSRFFPGEPVEHYVQYGWICGTAFGEALHRAAGTLSPAGIAAALRTMGGWTNGQQKPYTWSAGNRDAPAFIRFGAIAGAQQQIDAVAGWVDQGGDVVG